MARGGLNWYQASLIGAGAAATIALGGCCYDYRPVDKTNVKQLYLQDNLLNYPAELDCDCKALAKEGDMLSDVSKRIKWGFAVVNDILVELPLTSVLGLLGQGGTDLGKYAADKLPGGRLPDDVTDHIVKGDLDGAMQRIYNGEDTELGGHVGLFMVGGSGYVLIDDLQRELFGGSKSTLDQALNKWLGSDIISDGGGTTARTRTITHPPF